MKKLLLTTLGIAAALNAFAAADDNDFIVYENGSNPADTEGLAVYPWWNCEYSFTAANPDGGGQVMSVAPSGVEGTTAACSMGINLESPLNVEGLADATLNFKWYATATGIIAIRFTNGGEFDHNITVTADDLNKWNETSYTVRSVSETLYNNWNNGANGGEGYVFGVSLSNLAENAIVYFNDVYFSNVDNTRLYSTVEIPAPETVPTPTQDADNVFSFFSSYGNNVSFGVGQWGQSTVYATKSIGGKDVIFLTGFNYLGLDNFNIDVTAYDKMHVDYWTPNANTPFSFVPISLNPTKEGAAYTVSEVPANQWNSYDVSLSDFEADMSKLEQLKFAVNINGNSSTEYAYIANIYFYKDGNGGGEEPGEPGETEGNGNTFIGYFNATATNAFLVGETEADRRDIALTVDWEATWNLNGTVTLALTLDPANIVGIVPQLFIDGAYKADFAVSNGKYTYTTADTYAENADPKFGIYMAYAGGSVANTGISYKVGATGGTASVAAIEAASNAPVEYFNLQGVRVANPENGIFIRRQGATVSKVVIR